MERVTYQEAKEYIRNYNRKSEVTALGIYKDSTCWGGKD